MHIRQFLIFSLVGLVGLGVVGYKLTQKSNSVSEDFNLLSGRKLQSGSAEIHVSQHQGNQLLLQLDMTHYKRAQFNITFQKDALEGACLNIGDSASNDGWGGDAEQSSNNAELQVLGPSGGLLVYGSDSVLAQTEEEQEEGETKSVLLKGVPALVKPEDALLLEISNGKVVWKAGKGTPEALESPHLFALAGQADAKTGKNDNLIFAAFNRVIANPTNVGKCVQSVKVTLMR